MISGSERMPLPKWVLVLRAVQLGFAAIVLGCSAFGIYYVAYNAYCLSLFTAIATVIVTIYMLVAETSGKKAYNMWAFLAIDIFGVIFWLSSFSVMADLLAAWIAAIKLANSVSYCDYYFYCYRKRDLHARDVSVGKYRDIIAVTLAFSVLEFLLFITSLTVVGIAVHRHRTSATASHEVALESTHTKEEVNSNPVEPGHAATPETNNTVPAYS